MHAALILWIALSYSVSGLVAWWHRPANRIGPLMVLTGSVTLASTLYWSDNAVLHTVGVALDVMVLVLIVHVFLAFPPAGCADGSSASFSPSATWQPWRSAGRHAARWAGSPAATGSRRSVEIAIVIHGVELVVISLVALVAVGILVARRRAGGRPLRRSFSLLIDSFALGLMAIAVLLLVGVLGGPAFPTIQQVSLAVLGLAPIAFLPAEPTPGWLALPSVTWSWTYEASRQICRPRFAERPRSVPRAGVLAAAVRQLGGPGRQGGRAAD